MMRTLIEFGIAGLSLVCCLAFFPKVAALLRDERTRWLSLALVVLIAGGVIGDTRALTDSSAFKLVYAGLFLLFIFASLTGPATNRCARTSIAPLLFLLALWGWLFIINAVQNASTSTMGELFIRLAPGILWIAVLVVWRRSPVDREMLAIISAFALTIPGLMLPFVGEAWRPCDEFKCGVFGGMLAGAYGSENYLSQQVALVAVLHLVVFGVRRSLPVLALSAAWLIATESRTAQYALIAALVVAASTAFLRKFLMIPGSQRAGFAGKAILVVAPLAFIGTAAYFAITASPGDFSNRGRVWLNAVRVLEEAPLVGYGVDRWEYFQQLGILSSHFPHSLYVFVGFCGGLVGLTLLFLWLSRSLLEGVLSGDRSSTPLVLGIVVMTLGLLEVVWNPIAVDGTSWIPLILMAVPRTRRKAEI